MRNPTSFGFPKNVSHLILQFKIDLKRTVVFGDNHNDISMFQVAGLSIAMGNAEEELKRVADHITLTNDESGVSDAIYKYIL